MGTERAHFVPGHEAHAVDRLGEPWQFSPQHDVALLACVERHRATGKKGLGLVRGFGFQGPAALGSSVAHDSHNLIVAGTNAPDMLACARWLEASGGGFVVAAGGRVLAGVPLPVAGLLSTASAGDLVPQLECLHRAAAEAGCSLAGPFGTLSFLALPVIPQLRLTARGLFDVTRQRFVEV
jgi:adenine deaminase